MDPIERRRWKRVPREALEGVTAVIPGGPKAELLNLSQGGALLQVESRLAPRHVVRLRLARPDGGAIAVDGHVIWVNVAAVAGSRVLYHAGISFDSAVLHPDAMVQRTLLDQPDSPPSLAEAPPLAPAPVAVAHDPHLIELHERERRQWALEREASSKQMQSAMARADALQAQLDAVTHEHAAALDAQRNQFEAVIAELVNASQMQGIEYQTLSDQVTTMEESQRRREAEFDDWKHEVEVWESRVTEWCRVLEARLAGVAQRRVAFEEWCGKLTGESEHLLGMVRNIIRERPDRSNDAELPDTSAPDTSAPDTSAPDTSAPDTSAPDTTAISA